MLTTLSGSAIFANTRAWQRVSVGNDIFALSEAQKGWALLERTNGQGGGRRSDIFRRRFIENFRNGCVMVLHMRRLSAYFSGDG